MLLYPNKTKLNYSTGSNFKSSEAEAEAEAMMETMEVLQLN